MLVLIAGIAGSTEQDITRWIMTCLKVIEEVDAANPDGIGVLFRWTSSEKDVSYTVSKVQLPFKPNKGVARRISCADLAHS